MIKIKDYYVPDKDSHFIQYLTNYDHYQEAQRNRAISYVKDWKFAIDIGANIGLWSRDLSNYFDKLVCFEPNSFCQDCLKKNINLNNSEIQLCALGDKEETKNLFIHPTNSGASTFINKTKIGFKEDKTVIYGEFPTDTPKINSSIKKLDSFNFKNIDFIKIDVQGFELNVLKGAQNTLTTNNPVLCVEEDDPKNSSIIPFLKILKYELVDVIGKEHIFIKK